MLIAQITDCHVTAKEAGPLDGYDTAADLALAIARVNAFEPAPDLLLVTGDLVDHRLDTEYAHLAEILAAVRIPMIILPGNHDARAPFTKALGQIATIGHGDPFLHLVRDIEDPQHGPLRLLVLDSLEEGATGGEMCAARLAWIEARLSEAQDVPTVMAMHHPPLHFGIPIFDHFGFKGLDAFRAMVMRHPQIDLILCGHIHRAITASLGSARVHVCPATSYAYPLELREGAPFARQPEPPGIMLHRRQGPRDWTSHVLPVSPRAR